MAHEAAPVSIHDTMDARTSAVESTASAIAACEVAWEFYEGAFRVVVPDCTKAIVHCGPV